MTICWESFSVVNNRCITTSQCHNWNILCPINNWSPVTPFSFSYPQKIHANLRVSLSLKRGAPQIHQKDKTKDVIQPLSCHSGWECDQPILPLCNKENIYLSQTTLSSEYDPKLNFIPSDLPIEEAHLGQHPRVPNNTCWEIHLSSQLWILNKVLTKIFHSSTQSTPTYPPNPYTPSRPPPLQPQEEPLQNINLPIIEPPRETRCLTPDPDCW